ncbi:hypothetical protein GIB67_006249 [Kingdonia uniflora]|uniref:Small auxin up regulated protein n=1 Tax=Kingdonia uniflora TaxID=39325 RepID=A0A7J7P571_9MAGN|nr:hypothetical protein GIB67_006249 [Kingdonia uniflora]
MTTSIFLRLLRVLPTKSMKDVPKGFVAVYVGESRRRFVIPVSFFSLPYSRVLMERATEEYGFKQEGGLRLPCDEEYFQDIMVRCYGKQFKKKDVSKGSVAVYVGQNMRRFVIPVSFWLYRF